MNKKTDLIKQLLEVKKKIIQTKKCPKCDTLYKYEVSSKHIPISVTIVLNIIWFYI